MVYPEFLVNSVCIKWIPLYNLANTIPSSSTYPGKLLPTIESPLKLRNEPFEGTSSA